MEPIIVLVGFLGAGKTTVLKWLIEKYIEGGWQPSVIMNDYENANLDAQRFLDFLSPSQIQALSGSCICCSGVNELRKQVNAIPRQEKGITFIEANGTTDAVTLMEFLGVGINENFQPPIQLSVVDCRNWQKRGTENELEANQVQVSSLIFLNYQQEVELHELDKIKSDIKALNPSAVFVSWDDFNLTDLVTLEQPKNNPRPMDHGRSHWSSCSVKLPDPLPSKSLQGVFNVLPEGILRVKGCTKLDEDDYYTYFEKTPINDEIMVRPYRGTLVSGPTILLVGPGSNPYQLNEIIEASVKAFA